MNDLSTRPRLSIKLAQALATLLAVALLLFARKPDALLHPRFFAEDAIIFFNQDRSYGLGAFLRPYAGYYHLLVRLFAFLAGLFNPLFTPLLYALASLLVTLVVATICLRANFDLSFACRACMALAVVCVPHGGEAYLILTNIQWMLAPALLLLALQQPPAARWAQVGCLALLAVGGLTGPFLAIFTPIILLKLVLEKDVSSYRLGTVGVAVAAALIQFHQLAGRDGAKAAVPVTEWISALAEHVLGKFIFGPSRFIDPAMFPWLYVLAALVGLGILCWRAVRTWHVIVVYLLLGALLLLAAAYYTMRDAPQSIDPFVGANRYTFPPYVLITWAVLIYSFKCARWLAARALTVLLLVGILVSAALQFQIYLPQNNWPTYLARYERGETKPVPIDPPGWVFAIERRN